jgi:hypothetical protein
MCRPPPPVRREAVLEPPKARLWAARRAGVKRGCASIDGSAVLKPYADLQRFGDRIDGLARLTRRGPCSRGRHLERLRQAACAAVVRPRRRGRVGQRARTGGPAGRPSLQRLGSGLFHRPGDDLRSGWGGRGLRLALPCRGARQPARRPNRDRRGPAVRPGARFRRARGAPGGADQEPGPELDLGRRARHHRQGEPARPMSRRPVATRRWARATVWPIAS